MLASTQPGWPAPYADGAANPWIGRLVAGLPLSMGLIGASGQIMVYNDALRVTAGPENCLHGRVADLVVASDGDMVLAGVARALASNTSVEVRAALRNRPDEKQTITITAVPPGLGINAILAMRDFREQLRVEAQVAAATRMQAVGQLAGGIAHDFNNILTGVLALTDQLLDSHPVGDPDHDSLAEIRRNGHRGAALVAQLLAFARQQPQRQQLLDLAPVIADLRPLLAQLVGPRITLSITAGPMQSAVVADPGQIEQIIVNLAVNARDAMAGQGELQIRIREVSAADIPAQGHIIIPRIDHVAIDVLDSGSGIPPQIAGKIFEPFFTTKPMGQGTGLGLSTVYGIVKQSGGYIFASPRKTGPGTIFSIYLPAVQSRPPMEPPVAEPTMAAAAVNITGQRILLVEDDDSVRLTFDRGLRKHGLIVSAAADGAAALRILDSGAEFDVLVSDVMMPGIDGVELAAMATQRRPGLKVVLMSGYAELPLHRAADAQGVRFLAKPFALVDLVAAIGAQLTVNS